MHLALFKIKSSLLIPPRYAPWHGLTPYRVSDWKPSKWSKLSVREPFPTLCAVCTPSCLTNFTLKLYSTARGNLKWLIEGAFHKNKMLGDFLTCCHHTDVYLYLFICACKDIMFRNYAFKCVHSGFCNSAQAALQVKSPLKSVCCHSQTCFTAAQV